MFWDIVSHFYDFFTHIVNGKGNQEICRVVSKSIKKTDSILEVACGTGLITKEIYPLCQTLTATDYSRGMIQKAQKKCKKAKNILFEKVDIMTLPYPENSFDKVIAANVLHLLPDPRGAMKELWRVCKDNGEIIVPTYVNKEKKDTSTKFWIKVLKLIGVNFKAPFTYSSYQSFFKDCINTPCSYTLVEGTPPCAIAQIKKRRE